MGGPDPHGAHTARETDGVHGSHNEHEAHDKHAGHSVEMFPTVFWAPMVQDWLGYRAPVFPGSHRIPTLFGTAVFLCGGVVFLAGARGDLADRLPGMMTLISLAIAVAFGFSPAVALGVSGMDLWWELATLVTIVVFGHWIAMGSITQAQGALKELAKLLPEMAVRLRLERPEEVPVGRSWREIGCPCGPARAYPRTAFSRKDAAR